MGEVHAISIQCGGARSTRAAMLQIDGVGGLDVRRIILRRVERRWPRAVTVVALADTTTVQQRLAVAFRRLAVAFRLATPLVQAFGVSYLAWLTEDGPLRPYYMIRGGVSVAREWARANGVRLDS